MTNFAAVRLGAALAVVLGHAFVLTGEEAPRVLGTPVHVLAVRVFFVVSGYLVCSSWLRDPAPGRYLARRGLRIMPGLFLVVLVTVGLLGPLLSSLPSWAYLRDGITWDYLWNLALSPRFALPGVFADGRAFTAVNGSLWSLPVEVAMYLLLPVYAGRHWAYPGLVLAAIMGEVAFTVVWPDQIQPVIYATSIPYSLRFSADFVVGAWVRSWRMGRFLRPDLALLLLVAAQMTVRWPLLLASLSAVALPYAVLAFCLADRPLFGWLDRRADLSYGVYLWGVPVQQAALSVLGLGVGWGRLLTVSVPLVLGMAALSWFLVEQRALRMKPVGYSSRVETMFVG